MNRILTILFCFAVLFSGCSKDDTYAKKKKRENANINNFLAINGIKTISLSEYQKKGYTSVEDNKYICFTDKNLYMQIISMGNGDTLREGESRDYLIRFCEYNIQKKDTTLYNYYNNEPDKMTVSLSEGIYSATFTSGVMYTAYGSQVPSGWLIPFEFTTPGFYSGAGNAHVRLILPHNEGTSTAASNVYPTYYDIKITSK
ncbi:MAG: DUF4827 domain-containing protein [Bacteroidaceae bacterium]|nr:DUF4827 domain-containing protein [Bacteroidaceae bacterium]